MDHDRSLDWHLLEQKKHAGVQSLIAISTALSHVAGAARVDCDQSGFEWVVTDDAGGNVFAWIRKGSDAAHAAWWS